MTDTAAAFPGPLKRTWPAVPDSISQIRAAHIRFASEAGASRRTTDAVALAISEAAANSVIHGFGDGLPAGSITTSAEVLADGRLCHVISDDGCGIRGGLRNPGLGLGLPLIAQVADHVDVRSEPGQGTAITMVFALVT
jgi:anti-sigma regulatory factor (Ser/Thr protein kinase)